MGAHPDVDQALRHIRTVTRQFREQLSQLPTDAWEGPTNCPPWRVRDLAAHVVSSGETFRMSVERGVAGSVEAAVPEAERERRIAEIAASSPEGMLARLDEVTAGIEQLYERLSAEELEAICYHRRGNRTARWYICHRLAEVAFHRWDLDRSLGHQPTLDEDVATFLLPTLLESNLPRIYPSGPRGEGRFRLSVRGDPTQSWLLAATPDRLEVTRAGGTADVTITAAPSVLALLVYGRADLLEEEQDGRVQIEGDRALAERFHTMFVGP
jgi:uncharacterized protein (TIGR03083 family)